MTRYYCYDCDKHMSLKFIKRHLKSKSHIALNSSVFKRYYVKDIKYNAVEGILRKYMVDYRNRFNHFNIILEWKTLPGNNSEMVIKRMASTNQSRQLFDCKYYGIRFFQVECFSKDLDRFLYVSVMHYGMVFTHDLNILEMKITLIFELCDMT